MDFITQFVPDGLTAVVFVFIFIAVLLGVLGVAAMFGHDPIKERLSRDAREGKKSRSKDKDGVPVLRLSHDRENYWEEIIRPLEKYFVDQKEGAESGLHLRMVQAGYIGPHMVRNFFFIRTLLAISLPVAFMFLIPILGIDLPIKKVIIATLLLAFAGLYLPGIWISSRIDKRQQTIAEAFPDAIDMLVVCVEAGLGLDAAFTRVGVQIAPAHPVLASELGVIALELRAGRSRDEVLRNFAKRIGLREVTSFVTLLLQSEALGASVGQTLRVYSDEMRTNRMLRAEEMAHKLPVKLTFPLVACVLPTMFVAVMLPGMITLVRLIMPTLG